jgi:hypothetical protein
MPAGAAGAMSRGCVATGTIAQRAIREITPCEVGSWTSCRNRRRSRNGRRLHGFTSESFGQGVTSAVIAKFIDELIDAPDVEDKIEVLERAVVQLDMRVTQLEQALQREELRDYLDQVVAGKRLAAPVRGTMRTLISLLRQGERLPKTVRSQDVDAALIGMENQLNALTDESIYTYSIFGTADQTRFDPRFTLPAYIQGVNLYVSSLARYFPSRLGEARIRNAIKFYASRLEYFVSVMKSQIECVAAVFDTEEPRPVPGLRTPTWVPVLVVRNEALSKADGYLNRPPPPTDWREKFAPRLPGPFSVRVYNEFRKDRWTETERQQWLEQARRQIPSVINLDESRRLRLDDMLSSAATWRYAADAAASEHPLGLNVTFEKGRGVVIRFHAKGFKTTQPVRLCRHPGVQNLRLHQSGRENRGR